MPMLCCHCCAVLQNLMWGGSQNIAGVFLDSSGDSGFTFDRSRSVVRTVQTTQVATDCPNNWNVWGGAANDALVAEDPSIDPNSFDFRLYYLPNVGCGWVGKAFLRCTSPDSCRAYSVDALGSTAAHELGHSAGVFSSTVPYRALHTRLTFVLKASLMMNCVCCAFSSCRYEPRKLRR